MVAPLTARFVWDAYEKGRRSLTREHFDYFLARSYISGNQWIYHDRVRNTIQQLPRDPTRTRITDNRIWPASRTMAAKLLARPLRFEVPPGDTDDASLRGAHLGESILNHLWRDHKWEDFREQVFWSLWAGGTAIMALDWDAAAGTTIGVSPTTGNAVGTGDIVETVLTITEVAAEPGVRDFETGNWWVRAQALPPSQVRDKYNLPVEPKADAIAGFYGQQWLQGDARRETPVNLTLVLVYYERPNNLRPQGAVATVVDGKFVDGPHDWPFPFKDRLNAVAVRETKVPGRWTGDTIMQAAIPMQTALNASWSSVIEHMKQAGNARLMMPELSMDAMDELTDSPGEIIPLMAGSNEKPAYLSPPQMPQWWIEEPMRIAEELDNILGVHDVSRGQAPKNIESGLGLSILAEADSSPIGHLTKEMADGWGRFASLVLMIYADKVKETRKAKVHVSGSIPESVTWSGAALKGQTHAIVPLDAVMPRSRSAMMAFARELWDRQIIKDPAVFAKVADFERQDQFLEGLDLDISKARRENHLMSIGTVCVPEEWDDHAVHIRELNNFRKSVRYDTLEDKIKYVFSQHAKAHETAAAEEAGKQARKQEAHPAFGQLPTVSETPPVPMEQPPSQGGGAPGAPGAVPAGPGGLTPGANRPLQGEPLYPRPHPSGQDLGAGPPSQG